MRYWVYINDKVEGPYEETDLVTVPGFTPETMVCSEEAASNGGQEWKKANAVFEFDEVPADQPAEDISPLENRSVPVLPTTPVIDTAALLDKLNILSTELTRLQQKFDSMQTHMDSALEKNKQAIERVSKVVTNAALNASSEQPATAPVSPQEHHQDDGQRAYPAQAAPEEEEVVIRSALDSIYGGKPADAAMLEDTFQDLLPQKDAKSAEEISKELEFIPLQEDTDKANTVDKLEVAEVKAPLDEFADLQPEALITTPSMDEAAKDALISELAAPGKEDILDQIIQEHQQTDKQEDTVPTPDTEAQPTTSAVAGAAVGGIVAAGAALLSNSEENPADTPQETAAENVPDPTPEPASLPAEETPVFEMATDKDNPEHTEPVLPAAQMPQDVLAQHTTSQEPIAQTTADLPGLDGAVTPEPATPAAQEEPSTMPGLENVSAQPEEHIQKPQEEPADPTADLPGLDNLTGSDMVSMDQQDEPTPAVADLPGLDKEDHVSHEIDMSAEQQPLPEETDEMEELVVKPQADTQPQDGLVSEADLEAAGNADKQDFSLDLDVASHEENKEEPSLQTEKEPAPQDILPEPTQPQTDQTQESVAEQHVAPTSEEGSPMPIPSLQALPKDQPLPEAEDDSVSSMDQSVIRTDIAGNPNDLTEIELKEGSTYLISDFVPPAQLTDDVEAVMNSTANKAEENKPGKKTEIAFQDMMAATITQSTTPLSTEGLPEDVAGTSVNLENTIQAKRGASLDIKTVPMVSEPGKTDRLEVNDLNDVNSQHDLKTSGSMSGGTKAVIAGLIGLFVLLVGYVGLGLMHILPDSVNLFKEKKAQPAATAAVEELLPAPEPVAEEPAEAATQPSLADQAQAKVQQFPLPNGYQLQAFLQSKHSTVSPEQIEWTTADAVEADNYAVSVKVPPENPQGVQTAYRFNYNMLTGMLNPTNSDAKNLLDQAYGKVQTAQPAAKTAAKTTNRRAAANRRTTRRK